MRYKKPKYSNFKKFNGKSMSVREPMSGKRKLIIGIIIAVVAILLIAAAVVAILLINQMKDEELPPLNEIETSEIENIQILNFPDKLSYYCGEEFDPTGLEVSALTKGLISNFLPIDLKDCTFSGFDSSEPVESQKITVTYRDFTAQFSVEIKRKAPVVYQLESIALETLPKTEYKLGEWLNTTGGVLLCTYTDGTTKQVDLVNKYVSGFKPAMTAGVGEHELTVYYSENGIQVSTTYKITITQ